MVYTPPNTTLQLRMLLRIINNNSFCDCTDVSYHGMLYLKSCIEPDEFLFEKMPIFTRLQCKKDRSIHFQDPNNVNSR